MPTATPASVTLQHGDSRELLQALADASIDAVVTDPPYDLTGSGAGGFMGQKWDSTGIAFDAAFWREVLRVAKPGAHLLAFGGTRTHHRMMCALEDAGWEIKDCPLFWGFGTGFPKHKSLLKPAYEIIVMARKRGAPATLNIDACRIGSSPDDPNARANKDGAAGTTKSSYSGGLANVGRSWDAGMGRWPANVLLGCCGEDPHLEDCPVAVLDAQSGIRTSGAKSYPAGESVHSHWRENEGRSDPQRRGRAAAWEASTGGASRFFYVAKTAKRERGEDNNHPCVKPSALLQYLCRLITPPHGLILDPFTGSGSTGIAAVREGFPFLGMEQDADYLRIAQRRIAAEPRPLEPLEEVAI